MAWPRSSDPGELRAEGLAGRDQELEPDQVQAGDGLGDRVLDLDAGVDLQEPELLPGEEELDRAGAHVADGAGHGQGGVAQAFAQGGTDRGRRGLLDQLLVAALDRALALEQVHHAPARVGQQLDLDVARGLQPAFEEHLVAAERALGLAAGRLHGLGQVGRVADHPHADPAAAVGRLDHQGEADPLPASASSAAPAPGHRLAREHRHPGAGRDPLGLQLVAEGGQHLRGRPHEGQAALAAAGGELGPLGQEPVAGVDGVGAGALGRVQDGLEVEVGVGRAAPPSGTASSARATNGASRSGPENTATVAMPMDRAVRRTRAAISPRLATSSLAITSGTPRSRPCPSPPPSGRPTGRCRARCGCRAGR